MASHKTVGPFTALANGSLEEILDAASQSQITTTDDLEKWLAETIINEAKRLIRRKAAAEKEISSLKAQTLEAKIIGLKRTQDDSYGDLFNRKVSTLLDELLDQGVVIPSGTSQLAYAESLVKDRLRNEITVDDVRKFLETRSIEKTKTRLKTRLDRLSTRLNSPELALKCAALLYEIDCQKTDDIWNLGRFEEVIIAGIKGEEINLLTMLCTINQFDYDGNYTLIPDLDAYKVTPKLEAVPLILDELFAIQNLLRFYGVANKLTVFVADTDYTEIGQYGPVSEQNLTNLERYIKNLRDYVSKFDSDIKVRAISEVTNNNPDYEEVKTRVLTNVTNFKDQNFERKWYSRFEQAVEKVSESQTKKKLFPQSEIRRRSLEITRNIWATNAGQGTVFSSFNEKTILLSTERRERDTNYVIDEKSTKNFPPVIYVLKTADVWNKKLTTETA